MANPAPWPHAVMIAAPPKFGFTRAQQGLLEMALLDYSDRQVGDGICSFPLMPSKSAGEPFIPRLVMSNLSSWKPRPPVRISGASFCRDSVKTLKSCAPGNTTPSG